MIMFLIINIILTVFETLFLRILEFLTSIFKSNQQKNQVEKLVFSV